MPYTLRRSDGSVLLNIPDQTINKSELPIALVGRGAVNYGTDFAENFIHILENFANLSPPARPMMGMLWYDTGNGELKLFNGSTWTGVIGNVSMQPLPNTIALRDGESNIQANLFFGDLRGGADTAGKWKTGRVLNLTGDATGSVLMDGSADMTLPVSVNNAGTAGTAITAERWTTPRRIILTGQVDGEGTIDGGTDVTISCTVTNVTGEALGTPENTPNALARRDASGNFSASRITAALTGNADTATKLATARAINLSGNVTGIANFDGSGDIQINTSVTSVPASALQPTGVVAGSYTLANITVDAGGRITAAANGIAGSSEGVVNPGAIGSYTFAVAVDYSQSSGSTYRITPATIGMVVSGSVLAAASASVNGYYNVQSFNFSGTWRAMSTRYNPGNQFDYVLWQRIA